MLHEVLAWISVDYTDSTEKPSITLRVYATRWVNEFTNRPYPKELNLKSRFTYQTDLKRGLRVLTFLKCPQSGSQNLTSPCFFN